MVAAAVIGGAVVGGLATAYSGSQQADAVGSAADTQARATEASIAEQRAARLANEQRIDPFVKTAHRLLPRYEEEIMREPTADEVMSRPGYQFGLQQGQQALDRKRAAAGVGRLSGASFKAATRYGVDYATAGYGAEVARREARLSRLGQLAGLAPITASMNANTSSANAISGLLSSQGDAAAAGQIARGNIWGNATNQIGALAQRGVGAYGANTGTGSYQDIAQSGSQGYIDPLNYSNNYG